MKVDIMFDLDLMNKALNKQGSFSQMDNHQISEYISKKTNDMMDFIYKYFSEDFNYVHYQKKKILQEIIIELNHLKSVLKVYQKTKDNSDESLNILKNILINIQKKFSDYAELKGSVYAFRHCNKLKRRVGTPEAYEGIPTADIKRQAVKVADNIINEILMSPKKVRIIIKHSDEDRTRIFKDIIIHRILTSQNFLGDKVLIKDMHEDRNLRFSYWTKDAFNEAIPTLKKKGEYYSFKSWFKNENEFKTFTKQPKVDDVVNGFKDFLDKSYNTVVSNDYFYTIVLGLTHSWLIDSYLIMRFEGIYDNVKRVIDTADFCKVEVGQLCYLGQWVNI